MSKRGKKYNKPIPAQYNPIAASDLVREFFREAPKDVDGVRNSSTIFYTSELLKMIFSRFKFNLPSKWDYDYFTSHLFIDGHIGITDTELGVLPLKCGFYGVNVFDHPTNINVANPVLGSFDRTIGKDCVLIKIQYNYMGVMPLIIRYADSLAMCDSAISVNLMNSKASIIAMAEDSKEAETFKKMYDTLSAGEPFVVIKKGLVNKESIVFNPVKQSFIADDIMLLKRKIMNEFLTRIGINNSNLDKRERLITSEVESNTDEVEAGIEHWYNNIKLGFEEANTLYPDLNLSVSINEYYTPNEKEEIDESE